MTSWKNKNLKQNTKSQTIKENIYGFDLIKIKNTTSDHQKHHKEIENTIIPNA